MIVLSSEKSSLALGLKGAKEGDGKHKITLEGDHVLNGALGRVRDCRGYQSSMILSPATVDHDNARFEDDEDETY